MELIQQKSENGVLDFQYYANFLITTMATLCAPVRDEEISALKNISDVVPLYRLVHSKQYIILCRLVHTK